jgi:hypothetical protein
VGVYLSAKRAIAKNPLPKKNSFAEIEENRLMVNLAVVHFHRAVNASSSSLINEIMWERHFVNDERASLVVCCGVEKQMQGKIQYPKKKSR